MRRKWKICVSTCALALAFGSAAMAQMSPGDPAYEVVNGVATRAAQDLLAKERSQGRPVALIRLQRAEIGAVEAALQAGTVDAAAAQSYLSYTNDALAPAIAASAAQAQVRSAHEQGLAVNAVAIDKAQVSALASAAQKGDLRPESAGRVIAKLNADIAYNVALFAAEALNAQAHAQGIEPQPSEVDAAKIEALEKAVASGLVEREAAAPLLAQLKPVTAPADDASGHGAVGSEPDQPTAQ